MPNLSFKESIDAPINQVFHAFTNFENAAETVSGISRIEMLTEGAVGVGTRFKETRVMFKREATEEMEVTAFEPNKSYTLSADSCGARFDTTFEFTAQDENRTDVSMNLNIQAVSLVAKLMSPLSYLMQGAMKKCVMADIHDLKKLCESTGSGIAATA